MAQDFYTHPRCPLKRMSNQYEQAFKNSGNVAPMILYLKFYDNNLNPFKYRDKTKSQKL